MPFFRIFDIYYIRGLTNIKLNKYTEKNLRYAVENSISICQALKKLGVKACGGNYKVFKKAVIYFNISTEHFLGQGWNKGNTPSPPKPISLYFENKIEISSYKLKNKLLKEKIKSYECEICGLERWQNKKIPLELHHIDGNNKNNSLENVLLICPNCHALTDNYRNRKSKI